ncbi:MAG: cyclophilin-like fold protein [Pleomorphochaeta sp.]
MIYITLIIIALIVFLLFIPVFPSKSLKDPYKIKLTINEKTLIASMNSNSSSLAFKKLISRKPLIINMRDYGSMEKVGMLLRPLPTNNKQITAQPGDIILYMGRSIVVYYDFNSWNFTKIGHIENITQQELKNILGKDKVKIKFELIK